MRANGIEPIVDSQPPNLKHPDPRDSQARPRRPPRPSAPSAAAPEPQPLPAASAGSRQPPTRSDPARRQPDLRAFHASLAAAMSMMAVRQRTKQATDQAMVTETQVRTTPHPC